MRSVFINVNDQLRSGWRIGLFVILFSLISFPGHIFFQFIRQIVSLPPIFGEIATLTVSTLAAIITTLILLVAVDKRDWRSLGIGLRKNALKEWLLGMLIGFFMLSMIAVVFFLSGWTNYHLETTQAGFILKGLAANIILYMLVAFHEEILFRGYVFQSLVEGIGPFWATAIFSALFGLAHSFNPNVTIFALLNITFAGALLSIAYLRTFSLWLPIGIHFAWNFTQGYIWGLPVSGTQTRFALTSSSTTGPEWLTGGAFGPEGGFLCTVLTLLAAAGVWFYCKADPEMESLVAQARIVRSYPRQELDMDAPNKI